MMHVIKGFEVVNRVPVIKYHRTKQVMGNFIQSPDSKYVLVGMEGAYEETYVYLGGNLRNRVREVIQSGAEAVVIGLNGKYDLVDNREELAEIKEIYENVGIQVLDIVGRVDGEIKEGLEVDSRTRVFRRT